MAFPEFFSLAPSILVHDALAELLGASDDGLLEYRYADAVRVAGHSCPTVAGAFLMARAALHALYGDAPAERGDITVTMGANEDEGTTGVIAQVFTLVTGAAAGNGFHGIGGRHARRGLLRYGGGDAGGVAHFRRRDTGAGVGVSMDLGAVPPVADLRSLMARALADDASADERHDFAEAWQDRVHRMLGQADDTDMIRVLHHA